MTFSVKVGETNGEEGTEEDCDLRGKNPQKESVRERRGQAGILNKTVRTLKGRE